MLGPFTKTNDLEALQMVLSKLSYRVGDLPLLCTGKLTLCEGKKKKKNLLEVLKLTFFFFNSPSLSRKQYSENFVLQHKRETLSLCYVSCLISLVLWNPQTRLFIQDQFLLMVLLSLWGSMPPHNALFFFKFYLFFQKNNPF